MTKIAVGAVSDFGTCQDLPQQIKRQNISAFHDHGCTDVVRNRLCGALCDAACLHLQLLVFIVLDLTVKKGQLFVDVVFSLTE